jgi:hypothetical protein
VGEELGSGQELPGGIVVVSQGTTVVDGDRPVNGGEPNRIAE